MRFSRRLSFESTVFDVCSFDVDICGITSIFLIILSSNLVCNVTNYNNVSHLPEHIQQCLFSYELLVVSCLVKYDILSDGDAIDLYFLLTDNVCNRNLIHAENYFLF